MQVKKLRINGINDLFQKSKRNNNVNIFGVKDLFNSTSTAGNLNGNKNE
jgi:hypothetical protein